MSAVVDRMAWELAEARLHETAEAVCEAWDALANGLGCALEGRKAADAVPGLLADLAVAEAAARAEVADVRALLDSAPTSDDARRMG